MAQSLMHAGAGINVDDAFSIIHGNGAPGSAGGSPDSVNPGSFYSQDDAAGKLWTKKAAGAGADKWSPVATSAAPTSLSTVTTIQTLDYVLVDDGNIVKWVVEATEVAIPANRWTAEIVAVHDGNGAADAVNVDWNEYGTLRMGNPITGLEFSVELSGAGTSQQVDLRVVSTDAIDVIARRVSMGASGGATVAMDNASVPHDIATTIFGVPNAGATVLLFAPTRAFEIPNNFTNARAISAFPAAAETIFDIIQVANGTWSETVLGTVTFAIGAQEGTFSALAATAIPAGDLLKISSPAIADATLADIALSLQANYL